MRQCLSEECRLDKKIGCAATTASWGDNDQVCHIDTTKQELGLQRLLSQLSCRVSRCPIPRVVRAEMTFTGQHPSVSTMGTSLVSLGLQHWRALDFGHVCGVGVLSLLND